jgi:galactonate dehydratase
MAAVSSVESFLVEGDKRKNWLFVKVTTDDGVHGFGECYTAADRERAIAAFVEELGRYLVGRDAYAIKHFTTVAYLDLVGKRGSMDFYSALSGIEQALWDIAGKVAGQPVFNLLGGRCRDGVRVYANGWSYASEFTRDEIAVAAERARELVERGFTALKFDPFPGPWRQYVTREEERSAVDCVAAVREAVGPGVDLLIEAHRRLAPANAIRVARMLEEYEPYWYEEPVSSRNVDALCEVRRATRIPIVAGEELYGKIEFRELLERRAVDIINPDVANCGGILELKEIAAMAEPHLVAVAPHNYNSTTVALAATIQAAATMPNFLISEYFVDAEARSRELVSQPFEPVGGVIALPDGPGLGLELDQERLARHTYTRYPLRRLRSPGDEPPGT